MNAPEPIRMLTTHPLRIALLGYRSHPHVGGQGIYLKYLSRALLQLGHQVDVISGPPYPELDPAVTLIQLPSLDLYASQNPARELRWRHWLSYNDLYEYFSKLSGGFAEPYTFSRRAAAYLARHHSRYDIVHDNQCLGSGLLAIQRQLPLLATVHHPITRDLALAEQAAATPLLKSLTRRWYRFVGMQIRVARQLQYLVTVSEFCRHDISSAFGIDAEKIHVIGNGIDTDLFQPAPDVAKNPRRIITTASSDQPLKGQKFLLQALALLKQQFPDVSLTVIGALKASGECARLVSELGLGEHIQFRQDLSVEALVAEYNRATVAVTPSLYEGFGLPAVEAMACGTAVVTSDGGALPEVVGSAGLVVPAGDSQALADAIAKVLANPALALQLGAQGRARIVDQFSWQKAAQSFVQLYRTAIANQPQTACTPSTTDALS